MARARREEQKRQRRKRRQEKKQSQQNARTAIDDLSRMLKAVDVPAPGSWPGASDPSLERPDLVKWELGEFVSKRSPGRSKLKELERHFRTGPLGWFPDIDHWATEEVFYHGLPGEEWNPIEAFLEHRADRFPPSAQEQLRGWKHARIGAFEVGSVRDDRLTVTEWDLVNDTPLGTPIQAITLNIGGVNAYCKLAGQMMITYLAPWASQDNIFCGMGYGFTVPKRDAALLIPLLALQRPDVVARPLPWNANHAAMQEHSRKWRSRNWYDWLRERLEFPFRALIQMPPDGKPQLHEVSGLMPVSAEQARQFGIYFEVPMGKEMLAAGATNVTPVDIASANTAALQEYRAFRDRAGPPPGMVGQPLFSMLE